MGTVGGGPGFKTAERVAGYIERHELLHRGDSLVVGVSGGADSTCLLHVLGRLHLDLALVVAHVDHGLSESSEEIAAGVARDAAAAGFDVHVARAGDLAGPNLQERARDFRYSFFEEIARQEGAALIATGHTLDDRVETTLARLMHGAPTESLAGIRPRAGNRVHPLLVLRRSETRSYCDDAGLSWHDDPANDNLRFERATVRTRMVPLIEERWGEGAIRAIDSSIDRLAEDSDALAAQAATLFRGMAGWTSGRCTIDLETLSSLPRALRRRVLELAVGRVRDRAAGIGAALDALDTGGAKKGARFAVAAGGEIILGASEVVVIPPPPGSPETD
jgi:tRNA(Ile)-lysidine synthase